MSRAHRSWPRKPPLGAIPIYPGLASMIVLNEDGGAPRDVLTQGVGTPSGTTPPVWGRSDPYFAGRGMDFTNGGSGTSYLNFGTTPLWRNLGWNGVSGGAPMSIIARMFWTGGQGGIAECNDNNSVNAGWEFGISGASAGFGALSFVQEFSSGNEIGGNATTVPQDTWSTVGATWTGSTIGGMALYQDGRAISISNSSGAGSRGSDGTNPLRIGNCSFSTTLASISGSFSGTILWVAAFRRALSPAEMYAWSVPPGPWQFFQRRPRQRAVVAAGGAILPVINNPISM